MSARRVSIDYYVCDSAYDFDTDWNEGCVAVVPDSDPTIQGRYYQLINGSFVFLYTQPDAPQKQNELVSGVNIKTINSRSVLGAGNLVVSGGGSETVSFVATENIDAFLIVTSTGKVANSSTIAHVGKIIGINTVDVLSGFSGEAKGFGTISNAAWNWSVGDKLYVNGTSISTTAPPSGFVNYIGTATASDTIDVNIGEPILL